MVASTSTMKRTLPLALICAALLSADNGYFGEETDYFGEPEGYFDTKPAPEPESSKAKPPLLTRTIGFPTALKRERAEPTDIAQPSMANKKAEDCPSRDPAQGYMINFNNVAIGEYLRFIAQIAGTNFIFNEAELDFNVTILSEEPTSVDHIMSALLQILQIHGLSITEQGNQVLIYRDADLGRLATVVSSDEEMCDGPAIMTRVFSVQNASPTNIKAVIEPLLSPTALVQTSDQTGHLIVTDITGNIDEIEHLLLSIDQPAPDVDVAEYHVRSTYIESLIELSMKILEPLGAGNITLVPQAASDTIFIVATPYLTQRALSVLEALDKGPEEHSGPFAGREESLPARTAFGPTKTQLDPTNFYIYKLQYHQGDEIQDALRDIAQSLEAAGVENSDLLLTISTIQWIQASNSLVISGSRPAIEKVKALLSDLDIPLEQVYLEVLVLRTTIANALSVGVEWGYAQEYTDPNANPNVVQSTIGSTQGSGSNLNNRLNPAQSPSPWPPLNQGFEAGIVGRFVSLDGKLFTSIGAVITALQDDQETNILLNPKILTQDNHTARIFVGTNIAFQESTISEPGSQILSGDIQYRDVGSELVITPILGTGDMVTLEISQSISNFQNNQLPSTLTSQPILKSETETRVMVPDGYFLVLSGQINDQKFRVHRGLPCLGGLPIIGTAFSTKQETDSRDNLIIFVRPHVIRTKSDMVRVTEKERAHYERSSEQREYSIDRDEALDLLNIAPRTHHRHDHYFDPCYYHDPCEVVCCD